MKIKEYLILELNFKTDKEFVFYTDHHEVRASTEVFINGVKKVASTIPGANLVPDDAPVKPKATKKTKSKNKAKKETPPKEEVQKEVVKKEVSAEVPPAPTNFEGKDKTLDPEIDTSNTPHFTELLYNPEKGDTKFQNEVKKMKLSTHDEWKPPDSFYNGKMPTKEAQVLTRMMNCLKESDTKPPISFFTNGGPGGAGKLSAQAGELMTMAFTTMNDKEAEELYSSISKHLDEMDKRGLGKRAILDRSWLESAKNCRTAIHNSLREDGIEDPSSAISNASWDTKEGVEALGLKDYKKNKGFSTDVYFKVKNPDGSLRLLEVSLKKDAKVFVFNSTTGKFKEWGGKDLPESVDPNIYQTKQQEMLTKAVNKNNVNKVNDLLKTSKSPSVAELKTELGGKDLNTFLSGSNRRNKKALLLATKVLAENGDKNAQQSLMDINAHSKQYQQDAIHEISHNEQLKEGMLNSIREEFPIKACVEGEEMMALGKLGLDRHTAKRIFGTDNWEELKDSIISMIDKKGKPILAYRIKGTTGTIPIANINVREDGVGYGGQFKFEMAIHPGFAKKLEEARGQNVRESTSVKFRSYLTKNINN
jgi:hypothetical protein